MGGPGPATHKSLRNGQITKVTTFQHKFNCLKKFLTDCEKTELNVNEFASI